ncbi:MAG: hypothetical protein WCS18_05145 [Sphaerochaetaceae bacterium]
MQDTIITAQLPPVRRHVEVKYTRRCELCGAESHITLNGHRFCGAHFKDGSAVRHALTAEGRA